MDAGIGGTLYRLVSAFDALAVTIGNAIIPYVDMVAKTLSQWAIVVTDIIAGFNWIGGVIASVFLGLAGSAVALLTFAGVTTVLATTFASIGSIVSGLVAVLGAVFTTIGAIVLGVVAVVGTFTAVLASFYEWENLLKSITSIFGGMYEVMNKAFGYALKAARIDKLELAWEIMALNMKKVLFKALDDMFGEGWKPWFDHLRTLFRSLLENMRLTLKGGMALTMGLAAMARGDSLGAAKWTIELQRATDPEVLKRKMEQWKQDSDDLLGYDEAATTKEIEALEEQILLLEEKKNATDALADAEKTRFEELRADYIAAGSEYDEFKQSSNEDQAKFEKELAEKRKKEFEKITFDTLTTTGATTGRSAAEVSANLSRGMNQIMKDQLGTLVRIEKELKKDRPNKGIWMA
jgi:hypothetical protein